MSVNAIQTTGTTLLSQAWLLPIRNQHTVAIGEWEMQHLLDQPLLFDVPHTPLFCNQVVIWRQKPIPIMDLACLFTGNQGVNDNPLIAIVAYETRQEEAVELGGLLLDAPPKRTQVDDNQACELPEDTWDWHQLAISCFTEKDGSAVPILDLHRIFSNRLKTNRAGTIIR